MAEDRYIRFQLVIKMSSTTLIHIIQTEVRINDALNPFNELFDRSTLVNMIDLIIKDKYQGNVEYDQEGTKLVSALLELNKMYETQVNEIKEILLTTGLTSINIVERIIASTNFYYMDLLEQQTNGQMDNDKGRVEDVINMTKGNFKNLNGDQVSATDISDSLNDAANEVIAIALGLNVTNIAEIPLQEKAVTTLLLKALRTASVLYGMKSNFLEFKFETATISYDSDTITFKKSPGNYFLIKTANKLRRENNILEHLPTVFNFPNQSVNKPLTSLNNGKIEFLKGQEPENDNSNLTVICEFLTFHFHLHLAKIAGFSEYKVNHLFKLFEYIRTFF